MPSVFNPSTSISISASGEAVFSLLADRSTWPSWNPFIPRADLIPSKSENESITVDHREGQLALGQRLQFTVQAPVFGRTRTVPGGSVEKVTLLETPSSPDDLSQSVERGVWRVGWEQDMMPRWLLRTMRVNEVVEEEGEDGTARSSYRTYMTFDGPFAWIVKYTVGHKIQEGLELWAQGLKRAAEAK